jgi:hypothetical protein
MAVSRGERRAAIAGAAWRVEDGLAGAALALIGERWRDRTIDCLGVPAPAVVGLLMAPYTDQRLVADRNQRCKK